MSQIRTSVLIEGDARGLIDASRQAGQSVRQMVDQVTGASREFKSAAASADVFEQAIQQDAAALDRLRLSIDPAFAATKRLEAGQKTLTNAQRAGLITTAEYSAYLQKLTAQETALVGTHAALAKGAGNNVHVYRGLGQQISQVGQMGAVTGDFLTAFTIQLPDMLGLLGSFPLMLAGAALAVAGSFIPAMLSGGDAVEGLTADMDALSAAMSRYDSTRSAATAGTAELAEQFGARADEARRLLDIEREMAEMEARRAVGTSLRNVSQNIGVENISGIDPNALSLGKEALDAYKDGLQDAYQRLWELNAQSDTYSASLENQMALFETQLVQLDELDGSLEEIAEALGLLDPEAARQIAQAMIEMNNAATFGEQAAAAGVLAETIYEATDGLRTADDETLALYDSLLEAAKAGMRIEGLDLSAGITPAADEAHRLATNMNIALNEALSILNLAAQRPGGPGRGDGMSEWQRRGDDALGITNQANVPEIELPGYLKSGVGAGRRGGAGGASSALRDAERERQRVIDDIAKQMDDLAPSYERDVEKLEEWRENALAQLNPAREGYADFAADVEFIFQERLAEAYREDLDRREDWAAGVERALMDVNDSMMTWADLGENLASEWSSGLEDAFVSMNRTGKLEIGDLVDYSLEQLARLAYQQTIQPAVSGVFDFLSGAIGGLFGGGGAQSHTGSVVGSGSVQKSIQPLRAGERLTVTTAGQRVFTPKQIENGSAVVDALATAAARPAGSMVALNVQVNNYAGAEVQTEQRPDGTLSIDIIGQVERQMAGNVKAGRGPLASAMQDRYGLRPNYRGGTR